MKLPDNAISVSTALARYGPRKRVVPVEDYEALRARTNALETAGDVLADIRLSTSGSEYAEAIANWRKAKETK